MKKDNTKLVMSVFGVIVSLGAAWLLFKSISLNQDSAITSFTTSAGAANTTTTTLIAFVFLAVAIYFIYSIFYKNK